MKGSWLYNNLDIFLEYVDRDVYGEELLLEGMGDPDTHELMTAILTKEGKEYIEKIKKEEPEIIMNKLYEIAKKEYSNQGVGLENKIEFLKNFDPKSIQTNMDNLAEAISAAEAILDWVNKDIEKVFITGEKWATEIQDYRVVYQNWGGYNSSDIVVKSGNKYYGVSLKKKKSKTTQSPTLLNKPFGTVVSLVDILSDNPEVSSLLSQLNEKKQKFFMNTITIFQNRLRSAKNKEKFLRTSNIPGKEYKYKEKFIKTIKGISNIEDDINLDTAINLFMKYNLDETHIKKGIITTIDTKIMSEILRTEESIFREIEGIIEQHKRKFAHIIMNYSLKTSLLDLLLEKDIDNFDFSLITGVGDYRGGKLRIGKAEAHSVGSVITAIGKLKEKGIELTKTKNKKQAYDEGSTAAKLFFDINFGDIPVLHIELRYKGDYTQDPQFQAFLAKPFLKFMEEIEGKELGKDKAGEHTEIEKEIKQVDNSVSDEEVKNIFDKNSKLDDEDVEEYDRGPKGITSKMKHDTELRRHDIDRGVPKHKPMGDSIIYKDSFPNLTKFIEGIEE